MIIVDVKGGMVENVGEVLADKVMLITSIMCSPDVFCFITCTRPTQVASWTQRTRMNM